MAASWYARGIGWDSDEWVAAQQFAPDNEPAEVFRTKGVRGDQKSVAANKVR
jgi:hypothetical protein